MRVETVGRVVDVVETNGLTGVLVQLDTGGEVWLPLDALTVQPAEDVPDEVAQRRTRRGWSPS